jgi:hypothetical protein
MCLFYKLQRSGHIIDKYKRISNIIVQQRSNSVIISAIQLPSSVQSLELGLVVRKDYILVAREYEIMLFIASLYSEPDEEETNG